MKAEEINEIIDDVLSDDNWTKAAYAESSRKIKELMKNIAIDYALFVYNEIADLPGHEPDEDEYDEWLFMKTIPKGTPPHIAHKAYLNQKK